MSSNRHGGQAGMWTGPARAAAGRKSAQMYAARSTGTVLMPRYQPPAGSWWTCPTGLFYLLARVECERMRRGVLPRPVAKVLDEVCES